MCADVDAVGCRHQSGQKQTSYGSIVALCAEPPLACLFSLPNPVERHYETNLGQSCNAGYVLFMRFCALAASWRMGWKATEPNATYHKKCNPSSC